MYQLHPYSPKDKKPPKGIKINTTSRSTEEWSKQLSPFFLGPIKMYNNYVSENMENCWQYCKCYPSLVDDNNEPTEDYWLWAKTGWANKQAVRYPMGKNGKPLYSLWNNQKLSYIEARKFIYWKLYSEAVQKTEGFQYLKSLYETGNELALFDFDGYDFHALEMDFEDVLNSTEHKMGHSLVLCGILEGINIDNINIRK